MKPNLLFLLLVCVFTQPLTAQTFTESPQFPPLEGVENSAVAFADVDGDNDQDMLITGQTSSGTLISTLYLNDGSGMFTEMMGTPFDGIAYSSVDFADVDSDNDLDVLITGRANGLQSAKLYRNDGVGNFTEMMGTTFTGVEFSSSAFADVDGDSDLDVLICGQNSNGFRISKLYLNDGTGSFTEQGSTPFEGLAGGSIAFADVDGDNDQDVIITGQNSVAGANVPGMPVMKLYLNDGSGNFSEMMDTPFAGISSSSVAFADVDGDNDQDLLVSGTNLFGSSITGLYLNDGAGGFSPARGFTFEKLFFAAVAFADVDEDSDLDILMTGRNGSGEIVANLYTNDGAGIYTEMMTSLEGAIGAIAFADVDGDADQDVLISGGEGSSGLSSSLYLNDGIVSSTDDVLSDFHLDVNIFPNPSCVRQALHHL